MEYTYSKSVNYSEYSSSKPKRYQFNLAFENWRSCIASISLLYLKWKLWRQTLIRLLLSKDEIMPYMIEVLSFQKSVITVLLGITKSWGLSWARHVVFVSGSENLPIKYHDHHDRKKRLVDEKDFIWGWNWP